jgi:hypothetical protein
MQQARKPILSHLQSPSSGHRPDFYFPVGSPELAMLYGHFSWQYHDLCLFHQAIYEQINKRKDTLASVADANREYLSASIEDEWQGVIQSRARDAIYIHDQETRSMENYADQLLVIGLWAIVEQYCGRTLIHAEGAISAQSTLGEAPHKWQALVSRLRNIGVNLLDCKSYQQANVLPTRSHIAQAVGRISEA